MAIQTINLGSAPSGAGGDTQRAANTKINQNFTNTAHAASQLMSTAGGIVPTWTNAYGVNNTGWGGVTAREDRASSKPVHGEVRKMLAASIGLSHVRGSWAGAASIMSTSGYGLALGWGQVDPTEFYISGIIADELQAWRKVYHSGNTTLDGGYLKPSSPVLRLGHNEFEKEHEAKQLDIKVDNPETGVYKITGTTGLRDDGTWYFSPPKDDHLNVLCMVEIEEDGDIITVKTYAKKFDFNTVSIVPDYEQPIDIPDSAVVLLRFNDLPQDDIQDEVTDEPIE